MNPVAFFILGPVASTVSVVGTIYLGVRWFREWRTERDRWSA